MLEEKQVMKEDLIIRGNNNPLNKILSDYPSTSALQCFLL